MDGRPYGGGPLDGAGDYAAHHWGSDDGPYDRSDGGHRRGGGGRDGGYGRGWGDAGGGGYDAGAGGGYGGHGGGGGRGAAIGIGYGGVYDEAGRGGVGLLHGPIQGDEGYWEMGERGPGGAGQRPGLSSFERLPTGYFLPPPAPGPYHHHQQQQLGDAGLCYGPPVSMLVSGVLRDVAGR